MVRGGAVSTKAPALHSRGYAFARVRFTGKGVLLGIVLSILMVPSQVYLLSQYQIIQGLELLNTIPGIGAPGLFSAFGTFLMRQFFRPVQRGRLVLPAGDVREPFVDLDDLADLATARLTEEGHAGRVYEITGPRLLSMADVAAELSQATGRQICYQPSTPAEFVADVAADGIPASEAESLAALFQHVLDGRNASLTEDLETALGRPSIDFAHYARRVAATGLWDEGSAAHS